MKNINLNKLKIALVHDFFLEYGGAERVVEVIHDLFPNSDVFTSLINKKNMKIHWYRFHNWRFKTSWFGKTPILKNYPSPFRFLIPLIWESFDLSSYDLVISSSGWLMCKGVITRPETLHISYIHHQNKFLTYYETPDTWRQNTIKRIYGHLVGTPLRMWDYVSSSRPDIMIANSKETQKRISKYYRRKAQVIYPPVKDPKVKITSKLKEVKNYYLNVNRLSRPKHVEVLIKAANKLGIKLYIVGHGREYSYLKSIAQKNIVFTGEISDIELDRLYMGAKGFLFASQDEEFGIAPVEAMMCGIPVIAYNSGGLKETVQHGVNGLLVEKLEPELFVKAIRQFGKMDYAQLSKQAHKSAKRFSVSEFQNHLLDVVKSNLQQS